MMSRVEAKRLGTTQTWLKPAEPLIKNVYMERYKQLKAAAPNSRRKKPEDPTLVAARMDIKKHVAKKRGGHGKTDAVAGVVRAAETRLEIEGREATSSISMYNWTSRKHEAKGRGHQKSSALRAI